MYSTSKAIAVVLYILWGFCCVGLRLAFAVVQEAHRRKAVVHDAF